jgi:hypothetical protein
MRQRDQRLPEFERITAVAWMRAAYGKRYMPKLYDLAGGIQTLRDYKLGRSKKRKLSVSIGKKLLAIAISSTPKLRQVADALDALDTEERCDPRMANIVSAYACCANYPPTFPELRKKFVEMFGEQSWPQPEFSIRNRLRGLGLPLAKAKRGRPARTRPKRRRRQWGDPIKTFAVSKREIGSLRRLEQ